MTIKIRLMTANDIPDGMRLKDIAGWNQTAEDWERFLLASPDGCFAAECDGRVIGTVTTITYEEKLAWLGMVLVDPPHRGKGLGTALLERAIEHLDSRGVGCMKLDATPYGKPLYEKLGFVSECQIERWMLKRQSTEKPAPKLDSVELEDALELDRQVFGVDRNRLLLSIAETDPDFALTLRQDTGISGYAFGRRGSLADQLGPWTARDENVAAALLDQFLRRSTRDLVFVDCLCGNPWALPLLKARGFELSRPLTRMFRGTNQHPEKPEFLYAILGPEFG
ncbi:MAG: GNAT family N-acetyltransferase [Thermodesulfobacteriota bacterium]